MVEAQKKREMVLIDLRISYLHCRFSQIAIAVSLKLSS